MSQSYRDLLHDNESAQAGVFRLFNNTWNIGSLVNGSDFTLRISFDNDAFYTDAGSGLLRNIEFAWNFPVTAENHVLAYPEVIVGASPWSDGGSTELTGRITALENLDVSFDLATGTGNGTASPGSNLTFDIWLTDAASGGSRTITTELMVWLSSDGFTPAGSVVSRYEDGAFSGDVWRQDGFSAAEGVEWRYIALTLDTPTLDGTLDLDRLLRHLVDTGLVDRDDFVLGYELGAEVAAGNGGFTLNSLSHDAGFHAITERADRITGTGQDDLIDGRSGSDVIRGRAGDDILYGRNGYDRLFGGSGNDRLYGESGNDELRGATGRDILGGGRGADDFVFASAAEIGGTPTNRSRDRITDFSQGDGDRIDLGRIDADATRSGNQDFTWLGTAGFTGAGAELRTEFWGDRTMVLGDTDGDWTADFTLELKGTVTLGVDDFLL